MRTPGFSLRFCYLKTETAQLWEWKKPLTDMFTNSRPWSTKMSTLEAEMALDEQLHEVEENNKTTRWDGSSLNLNSSPLWKGRILKRKGLSFKHHFFLGGAVLSLGGCSSFSCREFMKQPQPLGLVRVGFFVHILLWVITRMCIETTL